MRYFLIAYDASNDIEQWRHDVVMDLAFADDGVLLMTEKDAGKCASLTAREAWVLPVDAQIAASADGKSLLDRILEEIDGRTIA